MVNVSPFRNAGLSFIKTMVMTTGEFEYDSIFGHNNESRNLLTSFPVVAYILWIIFLIIMPILLTNLLVRGMQAIVNRFLHFCVQYVGPGRILSLASNISFKHSPNIWKFMFFTGGLVCMLKRQLTAVDVNTYVVRYRQKVYVGTARNKVCYHSSFTGGVGCR